MRKSKPSDAWVEFATRIGNPLANPRGDDLGTFPDEGSGAAPHCLRGPPEG